MAVLTWDTAGQRFYETGVDRGVLYKNVSSTWTGYAWNGLISVSESPSGAEANPFWADNIKYLNLISVEEFGATIEAYTYPPEFEGCDGFAQINDGVTIGQQNRETFGLSYRTQLGNDEQGNDYGYKIHIIYGCKAAPSERAYSTINDSPEPITFSWELSTTPVAVTGQKPTASLTIESTSSVISAVEDLLYGTASNPATLPMPDQIAALTGAGG